MSDTTETETETNTNTDEPSKAELHDRVKQLESTVEKLMPSRRDALKLGAAGIAGAAGLSATSGSADAATGSAGQIGDSSNRPDIFADTVDANQLSGVSTGADRQGCRVTLSSDQNTNGSTKIAFDSEEFDSGGNFDTSSHDWTCPQDGLYIANLQVQVIGGTSNDLRKLFIGNTNTDSPNGEGAFLQKDIPQTGDTLRVQTVNQYNSGDTISAYYNNTSNTGTLDSGRTFFEVAFLGGL